MTGVQGFLRSQGYAVWPTLVSADWCEEFRATVRGVLSQMRRVDRAKNGEALRAEGLAETKVIHDVLSRCGELERAVTAAVGPASVLILNRHNHITVSRGDEIQSNRLHRDSLHWTRSYVTLLIGLHGVSDQQAWPSIIPGSHLWPIDGPSNGGGYWLGESAAAGYCGQAVYVPMQQGTILLLDPQTYHAAGTGTPGKPREVLTLAVAAFDELSVRVPSNQMVLYGSGSYRGQASWGSH